MRNVIRTDIIRAQRKKSIIICMIIMLVIEIITVLVVKAIPSLNEGASDYFVMALGTVESIFVPLFIGIPIFGAIYTDDFKSRSMQVAIGRGVSRPKMMLARFIEAIILIVEWHIINSLIILVLGLIGGAAGDSIWNAVGSSWGTALSMLVFMSLAMLFVYGTQNPTTGLVFYILFVASVFDMIFTAIDMIPFLADNDIVLSKFFPASAVKNFLEYVTNGDVFYSFTWGIGVLVVYIILPLVIAIQIFKKKELEF